MTLEILIIKVTEACAKAGEYTARCQQFIASQDLAAALAFCNSVSVTPPQCSLTAKSDNAEKLRSSAKRKLSDPIGWGKSLETVAN